MFTDITPILIVWNKRIKGFSSLYNLSTRAKPQIPVDHLRLQAVWKLILNLQEYTSWLYFLFAHPDDSALRTSQTRVLGWSGTSTTFFFFSFFQWSLFELKLKMLYVVFLPVTFLVAWGSKLCPHQCSCYEASELVDCRSRGLTHIPHGIPHGTWLLDLSGNKLTELRSTSFTGIWALRVLLLSQSNMHVVHSQVCLFLAVPTTLLK